MEEGHRMFTRGLENSRQEINEKVPELIRKKVMTII
jgi:hypothetical protein